MIRSFQPASDARSSVRRSGRLLPCAFTLAALIAMPLLSGCGGEATEDSTAVTPPESADRSEPAGESPQPAAAGSSTTPAGSDGPAGQAQPGEAAQGGAASESEGGITMPPGDIPPGDSANEDESDEPTLLMPDGQPLPDDASSGPGNSSEPSGDSPDQSADSPESDAASAAGPDVEYAAWDQIEKTAKSTGKITVVDVWALSCPPCLKEFPGLVRLDKELGDSVECISVDVDFDGRKTKPPESYEQDVKEFLASVNADGIPNYVSTTPSDDVFAALEIPAIPAVLVFDAEGELVQKFVDAGDTIGFTYDEDIIPLVKKLAG
jgi:thiol-disulfide isomerase/thioredoxin